MTKGPSIHVGKIRKGRNLSCESQKDLECCRIGGLPAVFDEKHESLFLTAKCRSCGGPQTLLFQICTARTNSSITVVYVVVCTSTVATSVLCPAGAAGETCTLTDARCWALFNIGTALDKKNEDCKREVTPGESTGSAAAEVVLPEMPTEAAQTTETSSSKIESNDWLGSLMAANASSHASSKITSQAPMNDYAVKGSLVEINSLPSCHELEFISLSPHNYDTSDSDSESGDDSSNGGKSSAFELTDHVSVLMDAYREKELNGIAEVEDREDLCESAENCQWEEEPYERERLDVRYLQKFKSIIAACPSQIIRFGGNEPIWMDPKDAKKVLHCRECGNPSLDFVAQIQPGLLPTLRALSVPNTERHRDLGIVALYTCPCGTLEGVAQPTAVPDA